MNQSYKKYVSSPHSAKNVCAARKCQKGRANGTESEPVSLIERIKYNDITQIDINYLWDDEHHSWCVDYEEENIVVLGSPNVLQRTEEYNGDIWIAIGKEAIKNLDAYIS